MTRTPLETRPISIAMLADFYLSWMGGANILGFMLNALLRAAPAQGASVHVLLNARQLPQAAQNDIRDFLSIDTTSISAQGTLRCLVDNVPALPRLLFYKDLQATLDALHVDVIGPCGDSLGSDFGRPWCAYLPDFQHQYLPHFFSAAERRQRDTYFRAQIEDSAAVFVNSGSVVADIARFHPGASRGKRVFRLPQVYADVSAAFEDRRVQVCARHHIEAPFLLSCSQRWMHKQHEVIVAAFAEFVRRQPDSPLLLVFTGEPGDHRDPAYAGRVETLVDELGLRPRVRHLGLIARDDQLQLVAAAQAVIQASRFEGGPGASGTLEAALLGTAVLASDIDANRELGFGYLRFFDAQRVETLVQAIELLGPPLDAPHRHLPFAVDQIDYLTTASGLQTIAALRSTLA
jgi:glycosyltransferase involved in cell wall biosynthesis